MMSQKELRRLHVIHKILNKQLTQTEAANILQLTVWTDKKGSKKDSIRGRYRYRA